MTMWKALYLKELKDNQTIFLFLLLSTLCLGAYSLFKTWGATEPTPWMALVGVPYLMALVYPFILTHSFAQELKGQTHYLLLALPVRLRAVILGKFAAVLTGSAALFVVATLFTHVAFLRLIALLEGDSQAHVGQISGLDLWVLAACGYFSITVLLLGLGTLIAGVKLSVRRFQGLLAAACFIACVYVYGRLLPPVVEALGFLDLYELTVFERHHGVEEIQHVEPELQVLVYSCFMGLLFLGLGIGLMEKRVEA